MKESKSDIFEKYLHSTEIAETANQLNNYYSLKVHMQGLKGSSKALVAAVLHQRVEKDKLFILNDREEASYFMNDLEAFTDGQKVFFFPSPFRNDDPEQRYNPSALERISVLNMIRKPTRSGRLIVTYPEALAEFVAQEEVLAQNTSTLKAGNDLDLDFLIDYLLEFNFERVDFVSEAGEFSIRGGIIDIFSYANLLPFRIELIDTRIDSIREFDPETQLSVRKMDTVTIIPNLESSERTVNQQSFLSFIHPETVIFINNLESVVASLNKHTTKVKNVFRLMPDSSIPDPGKFYLKGKHFREQLSAFSIIDFHQEAASSPDLFVSFTMVPQPNFNKNFNLLADALLANQKKGFTNYIFSESTRQIERIYSIFEDVRRDVEFTPVYKTIHAGFTDEKMKVACYTEHEIFSRYHKFRAQKVYSKEKHLSLKELYELKQGDYVVHINHGIGKFSGLEKLEVQGRKQETIRIVYKDGDLLYVSIHNLNKISRYVGREGHEPKLHRLGSGAWENLKNKTKDRVKDIARDLIKIYAQRKSNKGFSFSPDTYLQTELEASFIYDDTPDQARSTEDVKLDMEKPFPMDRLVCGDVGYGKTEVAIRAAFKAVADSKQVAVLVPTTILAFQHYKTFSERLKDFPCNVEYVSRFKNYRETREILRKLEEGRIDILIGTHKLIGEHVKFKDLGLLIIDEEQKFGVAAKEKLRALKVNVDTLSLTATPIPRTLQFSLMGVRDLSVINTPPANRQPIETFIKVFDKEIIREAIEKELERKGQVFFVHNRIMDIHEVAASVREAVPYARVAVAHGRLDSEELEEVMLNFIDGYYDVLVSTNIIESGLDIPNANTIIISNAHHFGLSDLYQMRGRVGRSNIKAFCYILIPSFSVLTSEARRRLAAIEEFTDLGSGFHIAMKDLDIRGSGNLLGAEQSGFITEIGLDLYKRILDEAMAELKNEEFNDLFKDQHTDTFYRDCQIDTDLEVLIPDEYVTSIEERLILYNRMNRITEEKELDAFQEELMDRFGELPEQVYDLLGLIRMKWIGQKLGIEKIVLKNNRMKAFFPYSNADNQDFQTEVFGRILDFVKGNPQKCKFNEEGKGLYLTINPMYEISEALQLLQKLYGQR